MLAGRGLFFTMKGDLDAATPYLEDFALKAVEKPMADLFSLYACYSITLSLQHMAMRGGVFAKLWSVLHRMATIWPLASTLLRLVNAECDNWQDAMSASLQ